MIRRLTSAPKPAARVRSYICGQVAVRRPQAVAHAVEAREVRRRLGRRDHVVGGDPVLGAGQLASPTSPPSSLDQLDERRLEGLAHAGLDALASASSARDREAQPLEVLARGHLDPGLDPDRGRVAGVAALRRSPQQQRGVGDVAGQRAALVERRGEGDHPVARDRRRRSASCRRSRTARRAGGSSRRCRCRSPTAPARRRPRRPSRPRSRRARRSRSQGLSTGP